MNEDEAAVIAAEARRRAALVALDLAELDAVFADDLVHVHSTGMVHDKRQLLAHIEARRQFLAVERGPLLVRVEGDTAVMTGTMTNRMRTADGESAMHGVVTQVLRREAGGWRFTSFQLTLTAS